MDGLTQKETAVLQLVAALKPWQQNNKVSMNVADYLDGHTDEIPGAPAMTATINAVIDALEAPDDDVVADCFICPGCSENRVDWLAWDEDGTVVTCATCGASYDPSEV